jgi:hypothetical protein
MLLPQVSTTNPTLHGHHKPDDDLRTNVHHCFNPSRAGDMEGHNKQESTTFILPYGSNKHHCMDKEEFHWVFGVVQGCFLAKLESKISDGSQLSAQFSWPPTATGT